MMDGPFRVTCCGDGSVLCRSRVEAAAQLCRGLRVRHVLTLSYRPSAAQPPHKNNKISETPSACHRLASCFPTPAVILRVDLNTWILHLGRRVWILWRFVSAAQFWEWSWSRRGLGVPPESVRTPSALSIDTLLRSRFWGDGLQWCYMGDPAVSGNGFSSPGHDTSI